MYKGIYTCMCVCSFVEINSQLYSGLQFAFENHVLHGLSRKYWRSLFLLTVTIRVHSCFETKQVDWFSVSACIASFPGPSQLFNSGGSRI